MGDLAPYRDLLQDVAQRYNHPVHLLGAMILVESRGNPYAIRLEPGFWKRYGPWFLEKFTHTTTPWDDYWCQKFPEIASASFGLFQVMYPEAARLGVPLRYPTELCDPKKNAEAAALLFQEKRAAAHDHLRKALLYWNGGGDPTYPDKVANQIPTAATDIPGPVPAGLLSQLLA